MAEHSQADSKYERPRNIAALVVEAGQQQPWGARDRGPDRTTEAVGGYLDSAGGGENSPASARRRRLPRSSEAISWYPISVGINAKAQRPDRKTRNARPSAGYAVLTSTRSHNATLDRIQCIRAIRSFLLISNLGCEGVNRRCTRDTRKQSFGLLLSHQKLGKQALRESGKYLVNEKEEEILASFPVPLREEPRRSHVAMTIGDRRRQRLLFWIGAEQNSRLTGDSLAKRRLRRGQPRDRNTVGRA